MIASSRTTGASDERPHRKSLARSDARFALSIVAGLVLFNVVIFILPLSTRRGSAFHDRDVILRTQEFVGFGHYRRILASPEAIAAILRSLKFTAVVAVVSILIGLGIALGPQRGLSMGAACCAPPFCCPGRFPKW